MQGLNFRIRSNSLPTFVHLKSDEVITAAQTDKVKLYVESCFENDTPPALIYHTLHHTWTVAERTREIAENLGLSKPKIRALQVAAWFHDLGYLYGPAEGHEQRSYAHAQRYLESFVGPVDMDQICRLILATKAGHRPVSLLESILRDADTYHFGTDEFIKSDELMRKETELATGKQFQTWKIGSLNMLEQHRFFTSYCDLRLATGKQKNMLRLQSEIANGN